MASPQHIVAPHAIAAVSWVATTHGVAAHHKVAVAYGIAASHRRTPCDNGSLSGRHNPWRRLSPMGSPHPTRSRGRRNPFDRLAAANRQGPRDLRSPGRRRRCDRWGPQGRGAPATLAMRCAHVCRHVTWAGSRATHKPSSTCRGDPLWRNGSPGPARGGSRPRRWLATSRQTPRAPARRRLTRGARRSGTPQPGTSRPWSTVVAACR